MRGIDLSSWESVVASLVGLALFALIVVVAVIAHRGVEQPAQRLIDRWTKPKTA